jgi:PAS domain S-box-containing protein
MELGTQFLRQIIDINPHFIFVKDRAGRFTLVNEAVAEAYGTTVEDLIGKTDADFNRDAEQVAWFRQIDLEVMDTLQERFVAEEVITDSHGGLRYLQTIKRPLVDADGVARHVLGVSTDITALRTADERRRHLEAQVQHAQKLESLGVLAGGIAHDFNNLLVGVLANVDLAMRALPEGSTGRRSLERVRVASRRAAELSQQMLAYSGRGRRVVEPVRLSDVVRDLGELLSASISKRAVVQFELTDIPSIDADPTQIRQVVMNLVTNASEALPDGAGTVRVRTGLQKIRAEEAHDDCTGRVVEEGTYACLEVTDTGKGMSEEEKARIFDPFYSTKLAGRGLGLAVVHGIVRAHGGAICLHSAPGKGTTFRVLLPAGAAATPRSAARTEAGTPGDLPRRVLVVDDEPIVLGAIHDVLQMEGIDVITAGDGAEAMDVLAVEASRIDGVLLDLGMPRRSGDEVLRHIREVREDLPVILMSGLDPMSANGDAVGTGRIRFLQKPFTADELVRAVRSFAAGRTGGSGPGARRGAPGTRRITGRA